MRRFVIRFLILLLPSLIVLMLTSALGTAKASLSTRRALPQEVSDPSAYTARQTVRSIAQAPRTTSSDEPDICAPNPDQEISETGSPIYASKKLPQDAHKYFDDGITKRREGWDKAINATGPPDAITGTVEAGEVVSLGNARAFNKEWSDPRLCQGYLIVQYEKLALYDRQGTDICVYEAGGTVAQGADEAVHVFVSPDNEQWYYVGKTERNGAALDLSGPESEAPSDMNFHYVGMCDDITDGKTGSPGPGPDIDAVAALNWINPEDQERIVAKAKGTGASLSGTPMADNETRVIDELADELIKIINEETEVVVLSACEATVRDLVALTWSKLQAGKQEEAQLIMKVLQKLGDCREARNARQDSRLLDFDLEQGGMQFDVSDRDTALNVQTPVTFVSSEGRARFDVVHDQETNETTLRATLGDVLVTPDGAPVPPFTLPGGYTVVVAADAVGEPFAAATTFMPVVMGE